MARSVLTAEQCMIGRAALGLDPVGLATAAGVVAHDVERLEHGDPIEPDRSEKIEAALAEGGVTFHSDPDGRARMRVRTLDGIIEAPVTMRS